MPTQIRHRSLRRVTMLVTAFLTLGIALGLAGSARAVSNLEGWLQDDPVILANPASALQQLRDLGVSRIRLTVRWNSLAPDSGSKRMPRFDASSPKGYAARKWAPYDTVVRDAAQDGILVNFDIAGPQPLWAEGPHGPGGREAGEWEPNDADFGRFVTAIATRYSGHYSPGGDYSPLPRVSFWTIWNEPNYGPGIGPQMLPSHRSVYAAPTIYRGLLNVAWSALHRTGHGGDTIVIGELTPRGVPNPQQPHTNPGLYRYGILPIRFVQAMYCLGPSYRPVRGSTAALMGCPTTSAGTARFRAANPVLFDASGFSVHPYSRAQPPNVERPADRYYASLADIGQLTRALDRANGAYHSSTHYPIWDTEYGYVTSPPKPHHDTKGHATYAKVAQAAADMNFAEYLSYENPRIMNYMQYLLVDPEPDQGQSNNYGGYTSGLEFFGGRPKPTYDAFQMPIYLPHQMSGRPVEVWGAIRPAHFALSDLPGTPEAATIQWAPTGSSAYRTIATVPVTNAYGYYDTQLTFPGAGTVRAMWEFPPADMRLLPGQVIFSRAVTIG